MANFTAKPGFSDFDNKNVYTFCEDAVVDVGTRNFAIQFDSTNAWAAINLDNDAIRKLLLEEVRLPILYPPKS